MSFQTDGYLSPDMTKWISKHRTELGPQFALADRLNRVSQQVMLAAVVPDGDNQALLVILFFARALSAFQGALLLVERGMTVEASTLARSCLESSFYLAAVARDSTFVDRLIRADTAHKKKVANWLTSRDAAVTDLSADQIEKLRGFLDNLKSSSTPAEPLTIKFAADTAQLTDIYETVYRDLSDRAAHPSLNSLLRHVKLDAHGDAVGLRFGPETKDIGETVLAMTTALFYAVVGMADSFPQDQWRSERDACWELHKTLIEEKEKSITA